MHANVKHAGFLAWLLGAHLTACSAAQPECEPGKVRQCTISDCDGTQVCGDNEQWESCQCPAGSAGSGGDDLEALGGACTQDSQCPAGSRCSSDGASGNTTTTPPGGACIADCTGQPDVCVNFDAAVCVSNAHEPSASICAPACEFGAADENKCGRPDAACHAVPVDSEDSAQSYCMPLCTSDSQCPGGSCDPRTGACIPSAPSPVADFGEPCDPTATEPACNGVCTEVEADYAVCSNPCIFGSAESCAVGSDEPSLCAIASPGGNVGDLGFCAELCNCDDDCRHPDAVCELFSEAGVAELVGSAGVCASTARPDGRTREGAPCM